MYYRITKKLLSVAISIVFVLGTAVSLNLNTISTDVKALEPVNRNTTQEARNVLNYLGLLSTKKGLVSGFHDAINTNSPNGDNYELVKKCLGVSGGLWSGALEWDINNQSFLTPETNTTWKLTAGKMLEHYNEGCIVLSHPDSMWLRKMQEIARKYGIDDQKNMPIQYDNTNPNRNMEMYNFYRDVVLKGQADWLEYLKNIGINCVMFRPFVETNGPWLYGSYCDSEEGYAAFRNVWRQMYDYFYNERHLDNVLMVYAPSVYAPSATDTNMPDFYAGDEYVDVIAPTIYNSAQSNGTNTPEDFPDYDWVVSTGKPLGFSEYSVRSGDAIAAQTTKDGFDWFNKLNSTLMYYPATTFVSIYGGSYSVLPNEFAIGKKGNINGAIFMNSPYVYNLEDLPNFKTGVFPSPGNVRFYNITNYSGNFKSLDIGNYTASDLSKKSIDVSSIKSIDLNEGTTISCFSGDNFTGTKWIFISDYPNLEKHGANKKIKSIKVEKNTITQNVALDKPVMANDPDSPVYKINDGLLSKWDTYKEVPSWVAIDLQGTYLISRWVVKHAGYNMEGDLFNTVDFKLQSSLDAEHWTDVDIVKGNRANGNKRDVTQFEANYMRLYVTKPNYSNLEIDKTRTAICELELYGVKTNNIVINNSSEVFSCQTDSSVSSDISSENTSSESMENSSTDSSEVIDSNTASSMQTSSSSKDDPQNDNSAALIIGIIAALAVIITAAVFLFIRLRKKPGAQA
jgi:hypothetical protein